MTQKELILNFLKRGYTITQPQAVERFNIWRLSSIIQRLRNEGYDIKTRKTGKAGQAVYSLLEYKNDLFD